MKTCPKCGKATEVTQVVCGQTRTHPAACLCEIKRYERCMKSGLKRFRAKQNNAQSAQKEST